MTRPRPRRPALLPALVVLALPLLAACADQDGGTAAGPVGGDADRLVFQVADTGGFAPPQELATRLPSLSVYADGRVVTPAMVGASYPGPAVHPLHVRRIDPDAVADLVAAAERAGVTESGDLGMPPVADVTTTRFTLVTADGTHVRDAYALFPDWVEGPGLTAEQVAARADLLQLLDDVRPLGWPTGPDDPAPYPVESLAAVATPYVPVDDGLPAPADVAWPGPALPGTALGGLPSIGCVAATGDQARAVLDAAATASPRTPWVTPDGSRWSVTLRPLLPHEDDCTDLTS